MSLSVIVPVHNEEESIADCIDELRRYLTDVEYEIVIVNDGSTDRSDEIISGLVREEDTIEVVSYRKRRGYAHAIRMGMSCCTKDYVSIIDADLQYHPSELAKMWRVIQMHGYSCLLGVHGGKNRKRLRRWMSYFYTVYVSFLYGRSLSDVNSLKIFRREILSSMHFRYEHALIDLELLLGMYDRGIPVHTVPIVLRERQSGISKCSIGVVTRACIDSAHLAFDRMRCRSIRTGTSLYNRIL